MRHSKNICFVYATQHQKLDRQNYNAKLEKHRIINNSSCRCCVPAYISSTSCPCCVFAQYNSSCPCCVPAPVVVQPPRPHPPSIGTGSRYKWRPLALQGIGEWHTQSHPLLLSPHSRALLLRIVSRSQTVWLCETIPRMGRVHCLVLWLLQLFPNK